MAPGWLVNQNIPSPFDPASRKRRMLAMNDQPFLAGFVLFVLKGTAMLAAIVVPIALLFKGWSDKHR